MPANSPKGPHHERIQDQTFRHAVDLLDAGDAEGLREFLAAHPAIVQQRILFKGNYFTHPTLLEFIAENPVRRGSLPANIAHIAKVILEAGAKTNLEAINDALGLVCSGRIARECQAQSSLINLLCDYGADPNSAVPPAIAHGEFQAVKVLLERGARFTLPVAAGLGRTEDVRRLLSAADAQERHRALALGAQFGHAEIVELLLDAGENPNGYNPAGFHAHSTPLHQAAFAGHSEVVRLLVARGARTDLLDKLWQGTPTDWARHGGKIHVVEYLVARGV